MTPNPLERFIREQGLVVLDGGLATELEARGHDLNDPLWSARVLLEDPGSIRQVHLDYLAAGADCIATATYQASYPGFRKRGLTTEEATEQLRRAVTLAIDARDEFWRDPAHRVGRLRPLVAASVGPYGAYLADGSEYSGDYGLNKDELLAFHRDRWKVLAAAGADLLACETIPSKVEAEALLALLATGPRRPDVVDGPESSLPPHRPWAWISFSCRDAEHISDGTPLQEVARLCNGADRLAAVGINCTAPELIDALIVEARKGTAKPILVYPNSGEVYDARSKGWYGGREARSWLDGARAWLGLGATGLGGCCRVGPEEIAALRADLARSRPTN